MTPETTLTLEQLLLKKMAGYDVALQNALNELTLTCQSADSLAIATWLRDDSSLSFKQCIDICGVDYRDYHPAGTPSTKRFAVVVHLLSIAHNFRLRLRFFADDNDAPRVPSLTNIWPSANWFEREAFDLYGIQFDGHPDLRRILTDYGFVGHPFRKDFPVSGYVEMHYDAEQKRVVYRPVTIEPREITPRIIREEHYGGGSSRLYH